MISQPEVVAKSEQINILYEKNQYSTHNLDHVSGSHPTRTTFSSKLTSGRSSICCLDEEGEEDDGDLPGKWSRV